MTDILPATIDPAGPWRCRRVRRRGRGPAARRLHPPASQDGLAGLGHHGRSQEDRHHVRRLRAVFFMLIGGFEALLIRTQLWAPRQQLLSAEAYNQVYTMHGTTMVFLVVMPIGAAFANYLMPLQIGARDVAFPRINAFSFWAFVFGGIFLNSSWLLGGGADGGWFKYAPNIGVLFSPSHGIDFWNLGLIITGIASLTGAVNLIVTVLNMRAPGMRLMKMPIFTWMTLVTQFLLLFAIPVLTAAQFLLLFDRQFGANFFNVQKGRVRCCGRTCSGSSGTPRCT